MGSQGDPASCQNLPNPLRQPPHGHHEHLAAGHLKSYVDDQVSQRGFGTHSEYIRELIRKDQERNQLRDLLLAGAASPPGTPAGKAYFDTLRRRVRRQTG